MRDMTPSSPPPFGQADLSNCERELIHLPGSIQPHGVLLVLDGERQRVVQASENTGPLLGLPVEALMERDLGTLGGTLAQVVARQLQQGVRDVPVPFHASVHPDGRALLGVEGILHRNDDGVLILELEPVEHAAAVLEVKRLRGILAEAVTTLGSAASMEELTRAAVDTYRKVAGYHRVMVYRFDPDGHGEVVAEAREDHLEPFLGLHYPSSDIPRRARDLYLRNRVRVLVDVDYEPVPVLPRLHPPTGEELDMSMSWLRSMSPLHLQYLRNMGVTATLVASLVREGGLWGLIACHHYAPLRVSHAVRAACDLIAEVVATRIAVLENFDRMRSEVLIRRLEGELVQATVQRGDWRPALLDDPRTVLRLADATGAVLSFDGEIHPIGDVPGTRELRSLLGWVGDQAQENGLVATSALGREHPGLAGSAATASGVLAVPLSSEGEYLVWIRGEQIREVRWAGNPNKPVLVGGDPRDLSPRRSFAVWTEQVRGTARPWSPRDLSTAAQVGATLRDMVLQVRSMSYLLMEQRMAHLRGAIQRADEGVLISDGVGRILFVNEAFSRMFKRPHRHLVELSDLPALFLEPARAAEMVRAVLEQRRNWRGELVLEAGRGASGIPLAIRADRVERPDGGGALGHIVLLTNLTDWKAAGQARERLRRAIVEAQDRAALSARAEEQASPDFDALIGAVLTNASLAVAEVVEGGDSPSVIHVLDGLEAATRRATTLTRQIAALPVEGEDPATPG